MTTDINFKNVPEIRFKDFENMWIIYHMSNLIVKNTCKNKDLLVQNIESISNKYGFIKQTDQFNNYSVASDDLTNYYIIKPGQFSYNPSRINVGSIAYKGLNEEKSIVSPLYISFYTKDMVNDLFLITWFKTKKFEKQRIIYSEGGVRDTLSFLQLSKIIISIPSLPEQEKIGSLFFKLDTLIATSKQKTKKLKMLKRALLQKMFASEKQRFPEIRFKGFNNEWEKKKFEEIYNKVSEKNDLTFKGNKIISVANMYFKNTNNDSDDKYMRTYNVFRVGDIAFEGHKSKYFKYGRFVENTIGNGIVSHIFDVLRPKSDYNLYYWKYFINNDNIMGRILRKCTTKATMMNNLTSSAFLKQTILVPSLPEQEKIGSLFFKLDALITTSEQKSAKLEELKKAFLQKMFI